MPHGQWALLGTDTLVLIDRSACLVEPRTCDRRIKCVPHGPLTVSFVSPIVGSLAQSCTVLSLTLRDLGLLLDDLFLRTVSWDLRVLVTVGLCLSSHLPAG